VPISTFICFRFYIVPVQYDLFQQSIEDKDKIRLFTERFLVNKNYKFSETKEYAIRINNVIDKNYYGKLSKKNITEKHDITPTDVYDDLQDDWPYLNFVVDTSLGAQVVVIEKKAKIFLSVDALRTCLVEMAKKAMLYTGFVVNFEPIIEKLAFWRIIEESESIYSLKFSLESPNMLGASASAREGLKELQTIFNNTSTIMQLENSDGELIVPKESVESYREYADQGGGSWELAVGRDGKKKFYKSIQSAIQIKERIVRENVVELVTRVLDRFKALL